MLPNKKTARIAGLLFLLMVVSGLFAELFFRERLFVANDMAVTAPNILANPLMYRIGIVSDIVMSMSYLFTALALHKLLVSVHKRLASLMVLFAAAGSLLLLSNILNELAPLSLLGMDGQNGAFTPAQLQSMAMFSYDTYQHGYMIGQVFFALWVLPLGLLIYRSKFIPGVLGILFVIETIGGLLAVGVHFLVPNETVETVLLFPAMIAEFVFMFWLLIKGINDKKMPEQNDTAAAK